MDKIISAFYYHDYILIITERGNFYKMVIDDTMSWKFTVWKIGEWQLPNQ